MDALALLLQLWIEYLHPPLVQGSTVMLVLTRRAGQRIVIDDNIVVSVVSLKNGQVRLGIEAPPQVHIVREELQGTPPTGIPAVLKARGGIAVGVN